MPTIRRCRMLAGMNRKTVLAALVPALITLMATDAAAAPDLKVRSLTANLHQGAVRAAANLGPAKTDLALYLSSDGKLDESDRLLARKRGKGRLRVVAKPPAGLTPGSYRLIACADARKKVRERNERNNCKIKRIV